MNPKTVDKLLEELSRIEELPGDAISDETLQAYREKTLSKREIRRVEMLLGRLPKARQRLLEKAGMLPTGPSQALRERVLGNESGVLEFSREPPQRGRGFLIVAGFAAAVFLASIFWPRSTEPLPSDLIYEVKAQGLAQSRTGGPGAQAIQAYPNIRVRIIASPVTGAVSGLDIGLYREQEGQLNRIPEDRLAREGRRGTSIFHALAADLVGPVPGLYTLYVLVGNKGDLPRSLRQELILETGLESGRRRLAFPISIELLPAPDPK